MIFGFLFILCGLAAPLLMLLVDNLDPFHVDHSLDILMWGLCVVFVLCGIGLIWWDLRDKAKIRYLKNNGRCVRTVVDRIDTVERLVDVRSTRSGHRTGGYYRSVNYKVVVSKDSDGVEYKSEDLTKVSSEIVGKYIDVYIDVDDSSKYHMDFDSVSEVR